jgi:hypothetical protein
MFPIVHTNSSNDDGMENIIDTYYLSGTAAAINPDGTLRSMEYNLATVTSLIGVTPANTQELRDLSWPGWGVNDDNDVGDVMESSLYPYPFILKAPDDEGNRPDPSLPNAWPVADDSIIDEDTDGIEEEDEAGGTGNDETFDGLMLTISEDDENAAENALVVTGFVALYGVKMLRSRTKKPRPVESFCPRAVRTHKEWAKRQK